MQPSHNMSQTAEQITPRQAAIDLARLRIDATVVPAECGPEIPSAPGRGAFVLVRPVVMLPKGKGGWKASPSGHAGRAAIRAADVFDRMTAAACKAKRPAPLTPGQISQGRHYRALAEQLQAGGMKLSNLNAEAGGNGGHDFMDAHICVSDEFASMRRRIGDRATLTVRRVRPSQRGSRRDIPDRMLVDMICLSDLTLTNVLVAHGWHADGRNLKAALEALRGALDAMIGYRG